MSEGTTVPAFARGRFRITEVSPDVLDRLFIDGKFRRENIGGLPPDTECKAIPGYTAESPGCIGLRFDSKYFPEFDPDLHEVPWLDIKDFTRMISTISSTYSWYDSNPPWSVPPNLSAYWWSCGSVPKRVSA